MYGGLMNNVQLIEMRRWKQSRLSGRCRSAKSVLRLASQAPKDRVHSYFTIDIVQVPTLRETQRDGLATSFCMITFTDNFLQTR
jgi:hypothetical protein